MAVTLFATVGLVAALVNWWSRLGSHRVTEWCTKPLVTGCVVAIAVMIDPLLDAKRAWFVAAFVCCLAGDVLLMLPRERFVPGLSMFAVAHVLFTVGMLSTDELPGVASKAVVIVAVVALLLVVAPRVIGGAGNGSPELAIAVGIYIAVIAFMCVVAAVRGNDWTAVGAVAFLVSDAMLGWRRFVSRFRLDQVVIMVTYHLALAALLVSLSR